MIACARMQERIRIRRQEAEAAAAQARQPAPPAEAVLRLQRSLGNRAVANMLARDPPKTKTKTPTEEFNDAVKAADWDAAALALDKLTNTEIQALLKPMSNPDLGKLDAGALKLPKLTPPLSDRVHRNVVFRLNPGPAKVPKHPDEGTVKKAGDEKYKGAVAGGDVSVHTDVEIDPGDGSKMGEVFELEYKGKDAGKTRWLQFISREIEVHPKTGSPTFLGDTVGPPTGNQYKLTTDKTKPNWNTDAAKTAASPFYEDSGINNRTDDATTMFDAPGSYANLVTPQFDAPVSATKVISRAHFATYLVRDMELLEKIEIDVEWEFTSKTAPPRKFNVTRRGPAAALDPGQKERLTAQFPKFAYLP
jgi:hypothetical protein